MADEITDELRLTFEAAMLETDQGQHERLLEYLDLDGQGQSKFEQLKLIRDSVEQDIGSVSNPQWYLNAESRKNYGSTALSGRKILLLISHLKKV